MALSGDKSGRKAAKMSSMVRAASADPKVWPAKTHGESGRDPCYW
jgi:hypothetical protein